MVNSTDYTLLYLIFVAASFIIVEVLGVILKVYDISDMLKQLIRSQSTRPQDRVEPQVPPERSRGDHG